MATSIVKFNKRFECWTAGDVAGFPESSDILKQITSGGFGVVLETREICLDNPKIDPSWGKRVPKAVDTLICPICGKKFKTKELLSSHKLEKHDIK